jgi:hypothetical protein
LEGPDPTDAATLRRNRSPTLNDQVTTFDAPATHDCSTERLSIILLTLGIFCDEVHIRSRAVIIDDTPLTPNDAELNSLIKRRRAHGWQSSRSRPPDECVAVTDPDLTIAF